MKSFPGRSLPIKRDVKELRGKQRREHNLLSTVKRFVNSNQLDHELMVVVVSYLFVFASAWNDGLIGITPSVWSSTAEWAMAAILTAEILSRAIYSRKRSVGFYALLVFDGVSVLTVVPVLTGFAFARLGRLAYASLRTIRLIDTHARMKHQPMYLIGTYPLILPLAAAILFAVERQSAHPAVQTYFDAVAMSVGFALTLGSDRPHTYLGNLVCGTLFVAGILCIGIIANGLSDRYEHQYKSGLTK